MRHDDLLTLLIALQAGQTIALLVLGQEVRVDRKRLLGMYSRVLDSWGAAKVAEIEGQVREEARKKQGSFR